MLSKALVSDPAHRPDDLKALGQALHNLAPEASAAVPSGNEAHLDGDEDFEVDVRLSMIPPAAAKPVVIPMAAMPVDAFGVATMQAPKVTSRNDPTSRLADLKARLESDPRPRYVVIQDGMDHGPFSAVELLQQIATNTFTEDSVLRDVFSQEERTIKDWDEFAPFAEQAKLHREIKAEKVELEKTITAENKATTSKALVGGAALAGITLIIGAIVLKARGSRDDTLTVTGDTAVAVDVAGNVKTGAQTKAGGVGSGVRLSTAGGFPVLPGGMSCEAAQSKYVEEMKVGEKGAPDLTQGQFASVLNNGSYLTGCSVPDSTQVNICAAVQNGRAVGVTVTMQPPSPGAQSCVASKIRGVSFPSNPKLDIARTTFKCSAPLAPQRGCAGRTACARARWRRAAAVPVATALSEDDANRVVLALQRAGRPRRQRGGPDGRGPLPGAGQPGRGQPRAWCAARRRAAAPAVARGPRGGGQVVAGAQRWRRARAVHRGARRRPRADPDAASTGVVAARVHLSSAAARAARRELRSEATASVLVKHRGAAPGRPRGGAAAGRRGRGGPPAADVAVVLVPRLPQARRPVAS